MKEFDAQIISIFGGLNPERSVKKKDSGLSECHNLEPLKEDYVLHTVVIDMNATGQDWNNSQDLVDVWQDNQNDDFIDNQDDDFEDI